MKKNFLVSIILPVYNVQADINRCIKSVIAQTYTNYELIIIDDGSIDDTVRLCKLHLTDKRIKLFSIPHKGLSNARNIGLNISSGEYISFIDGDDYIEPTFIEELLTGILCEDSDMCMCGAKRISDDSIRYISMGDVVLSPNEAVRCYFNTEDPRILGVVTNKLFKTHTIRNLYFDTSLCTAEDAPFTLKSIILSQRICSISDCLYNHILNSNGNGTISSIERLNDAIRVNEELINITKETFPHLVEHAIKNKEYTHEKIMKSYNHTLANMKLIKRDKL